MNDETTMPTEVPVEETGEIVGTEVTIYEDFTGAATEETTGEILICLEDVQTIGSDIVHADLFGSFLVCGTLIGLALFRGIHGT